MGDATRRFIVSPLSAAKDRLLSWQIGISIGHFQFTASYTDGTIVLSENVEFSANDGALLQKLLRHLETASKRTIGMPTQIQQLALATAFQTEAIAESFVSASPVAQSARRKRP